MENMEACPLRCDLEQLSNRLNNLSTGIAGMGEKETINVDKAFLLANLNYMQELLNLRRTKMEEIPHWIPVSERLPEEKCEVLVTCKNGMHFVAYCNKFADEIVWRTCGPLGSGRRIATARITHWMPLPQPPKE